MDKLDHAIHELTAVVNGIGSYRFTHTAEDLLEWLEELKKRREKQEWIPCEERLPKRQGYYICTCKDGSKNKRTTTIKWSNGWQQSGARAYWKVIAWMPLPEPYERSE